MSHHLKWTMGIRNPKSMHTCKKTNSLLRHIKWMKNKILPSYRFVHCEHNKNQINCLRHILETGAPKICKNYIFDNILTNKWQLIHSWGHVPFLDKQILLCVALMICFCIWKMWLCKCLHIFFPFSGWYTNKVKAIYRDNRVSKCEMWKISHF